MKRVAVALTPEVLQDELAMSLARALAVANQRARESGIDVVASLITISQRVFNNQLLWRINYGPQDYVGRRGGDLIVEVDPVNASIRQVMRGQ